MSEVVAIERKERTSFDAQSDLEERLRDLEAITSLMIDAEDPANSRNIHGTLWRTAHDANKSFDELCKLGAEERRGGAK